MLAVFASRFVIEDGGCEAVTEEYGRVKEYGPGDFFGELAVLHDSPRKATIRTVLGADNVVCMRLLQKDVAKFLSSKRCEEALEKVAAGYKHAEKLKMSDVVAAPLRLFWSMMVADSADLARTQSLGAALKEGEVTREAYTQVRIFY